ncbi:hypothetical protein KOW79_007925 [Hemibagrus wyckioides]|uniref:Uncharacterized protein n=1 Tax=Hemibagrus wyckioides TaxID=337641 RepID=A0A9D3SKI7_9TELE|nr:hypothetical protein KOW79_007925 [Hemibagrus wyckioides]
MIHKAQNGELAASSAYVIISMSLIQELRCGRRERKCTSESSQAISEFRKRLIEITDWQYHQVQASFQFAALEQDGKRTSEGFILGQENARRPVRKRWLEAAALAGDDSTPCQLLLPSLSAAWQSAVPCPSCLRSLPPSKRLR